MKGYQKNLLLALASIGATLVILEGVFSLLDLPEPPAPSFLTCNLKAYKKENIPSYYPNQKCYQCYHRKDEIPYSDRSITIDDKRFDCIRYHIGPQGFRTPLFKKKQDDELRIITIGDSFTFGEGAKEKDTFPRLLEEGIGIETVNIAMQGLNTKYERLILEKNIHLRPDFVILGYVLNDTMQHQETIKMVDALEKAARLPRVFCFSRFGSFVYGRVSSFLQSRKVLSDYHDSFKRGWRNSSEQLLAIKDLCHRRFLFDCWCNQ